MSSSEPLTPNQCIAHFNQYKTIITSQQRHQLNITKIAHPPPATATAAPSNNPTQQSKACGVYSMAGASYPVPAGHPPLANPVAVVSPQFCAPYPVDLIVTRKLMSLSEGNFGVTDVNGNLMFKVKGKLFSMRDRRILLDAADNHLLSFQQKILTAHRRWKVFRGDSSDEKDLLFSVKKSSMFQFKTKLDIFLASNTSEDVCDFKIEGSWFERSCTIYAGDSSNIIAQMHKKHNVQSVLLGKDTFAVTVYPNVDYAFIVALVVILEEINEDRSDAD